MQAHEAAWGDAVLFEATENPRENGQSEDGDSEKNDKGGPVVAVAPSVLPRDVDANGMRIGVAVEPGAAARALVLGTKARMMLPMLNDALRNEMYERAIIKAVETFTAIHGKGPKVLDIGAGTGLLSVMAAQAGAREVVGCEMNEEMAKVAAEVVRANGLCGTTALADRSDVACSDKVRIVACRSTDYSLATEEEPFDLIVTETLDSHLLHEGILPSLKDALDRLARPGAAVVPSAARVYAQLCSTELGRAGTRELVVRKDNRLELATLRASRLPTPKDHDGFTNVKYSGRDDLHGMELLGAREEIFHIKFAEARALEDFVRYEPPGGNMVTGSETAANAICVWWDLEVVSEEVAEEKPLAETGDGPTKRRKVGGDAEGRAHALTNSPNVSEKHIQWQDHWFPSVYPLVKPGTEISVCFARTETDIFVQQLDWKPEPTDEDVAMTELNTCMDPVRLMQVTDPARQEACRAGFKAALEAQPNKDFEVWDVGSGSLSAFVAAGFDRVRCIQSLETDYFSKVMWTRLCEASPKTMLVETLTLEDGTGRARPADALLVCSDLCYPHLGPRRDLVNGLQFCLQALAVARKDASCSFFPGAMTIEARLVRLGALGRALAAPSKIRGCEHPVEWHGTNQDLLLEIDIGAYEYEEICPAQTLVKLAVGSAEEATKTGSLRFELPAGLASSDNCAVAFSMRCALPRTQGALDPLLVLGKRGDNGAPSTTETAFSDLGRITVDRTSAQAIGVSLALRLL